MSDLISRQTAIDALCKALYDYEDKTEKQFQESDELDVCDWIQHRIFVQNMSDIDRQVLQELPSAQPERKKGKWIYYPKASGSVTSTAVHLYPVCSECGCEHPVANFCPNCGANMGEDEG